MSGEDPYNKYLEALDTIFNPRHMTMPNTQEWEDHRRCLSEYFDQLRERIKESIEQSISELPPPPDAATIPSSSNVTAPPSSSAGHLVSNSSSSSVSFAAPQQSCSSNPSQEPAGTQDANEEGLSPEAMDARMQGYCEGFRQGFEQGYERGMQDIENGKPLSYEQLSDYIDLLFASQYEEASEMMEEQQQQFLESKPAKIPRTGNGKDNSFDADERITLPGPRQISDLSFRPPAHQANFELQGHIIAFTTYGPFTTAEGHRLIFSPPAGEGGFGPGSTLSITSEMGEERQISISLGETLVTIFPREGTQQKDFQIRINGQGQLEIAVPKQGDETSVFDMYS